LIPEAFNTVISLSEESLPIAIKIAIKRAMGIVNNRKEGKRKITSLAMEKMLIPLLTIKSMIWRIFPISKTKVRTNKIMMNGNAISFNI
jgi:hypothetical protein